MDFPLDRDSFMGALKIASMSMAPSDNLISTALGDGTVLDDQLGERHWGGTVMVQRGSTSDMRRQKALMNIVRTAGATFLAYDTSANYPLSDPLGFVLGSAAVTLNSVAADGTALSLAGLPVGYALTLGDHLGFQYGSDPVRFALHEVAEPTVLADGSGVTPEFKVTGPVRPGAQIGASVDLVRACCKAKIVPGSYRPSVMLPAGGEGFSFSFIQTTR